MGQLFIELMRRLFALLDRIVILAIDKLYTLLIMIADTNVFGDLIYNYLGRIYTFLGIFMVFKLSLSMINYIINPDELTDKSKGAGKLVSNVVISLVLLVATPTIFDQAFKLQSDLLNTNAIYQIVTGKKITPDDSATAAQNQSNMLTMSSTVGKKIAYGVFSSFIYNASAEDVMSASLDELIPVTESNGNSSARCSDTDDPYCLVDQETVVKKNGGKFANEYMFLISTICGGAVAYILLTFCFDAATRAIKLGFLQIIAPIPILSMIDPKNGNKKVMDWAKECGKTFAGLFIRLAGLFFAVQIIMLVLDSGKITGAFTKYSDATTTGYGSPVGNIFVRLFIIIGALMFAKQLPQLIESLFGIKLSGDGFSLKKKLGGIPGLGVAKAVGAGALGFAGGAAANLLAAPSNFKGQGFKGFMKGTGSVLAGGTSGLGRGLVSKEKNMFKAANAGVRGAVDKRNLRDQRQATGYHIGRRAMSGISTFAGLDSLSHYDSQINQYTDIEKRASDILSRANGEMIKHNFNFNDSAGNQIDMNDFKASKERLTLLRNQDTSHMNDAQRDAHARLISDTQTYVAKTEKLAEQAFVDQVQSGSIIDAQTTAMLSGLSTAISNATDDIVKAQSTSSGSAVKAAKDAMGDAIKNVQNSDGYQRAQANKKQK